MRERGISPPPDASSWLPDISLSVESWKWLQKVFSNYPKVQTFQQTLTPAAVNANSESVQTFTVTGLTTVDIVKVNKPTNQSGLDLVHAWASAANTLSIKYRNHTGSGITPTAEAYLIEAVRL